PARNTADVQKELANLQADGQGFAVTDQRDDWREQPPRFDTFRGTKVTFSVKGPEGLWEKITPLETDEAYDLFLLGRSQGDHEKDNTRNGVVEVLKLGKQPDSKSALKAVRDF